MVEAASAPSLMQPRMCLTSLGRPQRAPALQLIGLSGYPLPVKAVSSTHLQGLPAARLVVAHLQRQSLMSTCAQAKLGGEGAKGQTAASKVKGAVDNAIGGN